jgi:hypothetical protein
MLRPSGGRRGRTSPARTLGLGPRDRRELPAAALSIAGKSVVNRVTPSPWRGLGPRRRNPSPTTLVVPPVKAESDMDGLNDASPCIPLTFGGREPAKFRQGQVPARGFFFLRRIALVKSSVRERFVGAFGRTLSRLRYQSGSVAFNLLRHSKQLTPLWPARPLASISSASWRVPSSLWTSLALFFPDQPARHRMASPSLRLVHCFPTLVSPS